MRAVVCSGRGPPEVLVVREVDRPQAGPREVLVRVRAAGVNALDWRRFASHLRPSDAPLPEKAPEQPPLRTGGRVLGADLAGVVAAVGPAVQRFRAGDEVFGVARGMAGAFAEYARASEDHLAAKPPQLTFEAAAAVPIAGLTALQSLRDKGRLRGGQRVLVHGASGGVGTFAVQLGRLLGAEVTAVTSARGASQALELGAVRAIDYAQDDFARAPERYDLIVAVNGSRSILDYRRALAPGGRCVVVGGSLGQIAQAALLGPLVSLFGGRTLGFLGIAKARSNELAFLAELLAAGRLMPVIDRTFALGAAAQAVRYLAQGHARGKVVLTLAAPEGPPGAAESQDRSPPPRA